jgi:hypothetical protein
MDSREIVNSYPDFPLKATMICLLKFHFQSIIFFSHKTFPLQNQQFQQITALACTVSSLMKPNATSSGTAGTEKPQDTNAHLDLPTIVKLVSVCGLIKFQNAKTKVCLTIKKLLNCNVLLMFIIHLQK